MFVFLVLAVSVLFTAACNSDEPDTFRLTILHHNNGNSQLINAGPGLENFGGVARFATVVDELRQVVSDAGSSVIMVSAGDNSRAGPQFNASLVQDGPFYDAIAMDLIGYDAIGIGNQDFDFDPDGLARFIESFENPVPFLSSNLDVSREPRLAALAAAGRIAKSVVVDVDGERIGIVGVSTPLLSIVSSPRNVSVSTDVAGAVQREVDALEAQGINKIIMLSNLQSIEGNISLVSSQLRGVDILIVNGEDLLANSGSLLIPGDEDQVFADYPMMATGDRTDDFLVVTTSGDYKYIGRLVVEFDDEGHILVIDPSSGPVRIAGGDLPDGVSANLQVQSRAVAPVEAYVDGLAMVQSGTTEAALDGQRDLVRSQETNVGNLMADALLWEASRLATSFGAPSPQVAIQNGGGIRNDNVIPAGPLTELDTFSMAPFASFVSIVSEIPADQFKEVMENSVSQVENNSGRFAQIAGFTMVWDPAGTPQILGVDDTVSVAGSRIRELRLNDGTLLVTQGEVVPGENLINIATLDFMAQGGDQTPYRGAPFINLGVTYQQALSNYIQEGLGGTINGDDYPEGGQGRITTPP